MPCVLLVRDPGMASQPNRNFSLAATVACDACKSAKRPGAGAAASSSLRNAHDIIPLPGIRSAKKNTYSLVNQRTFLICFAGFEYIVNPPIIPKVAFGSSLHREVMPLSGPSVTSYMRNHLPEARERPSPLDYDCAKPIGFKVS